MSAELDPEALTLAMALVPGAYPRNRLFDLYQNAVVRRARIRAALLRGVVRQLAGTIGEPSDIELQGGRLRYRIEAVTLERRLDVSLAELACLRFLLGRAGVVRPELGDADGDRAAIVACASRLANELRVPGVLAP